MIPKQSPNTVRKAAAYGSCRGDFQYDSYILGMKLAIKCYIR